MKKLTTKNILKLPLRQVEWIDAASSSDVPLLALQSFRPHVISRITMGKVIKHKQGVLVITDIQDAKMNKFITKDSGQRKEWKSGFRRDTDEGKLRYDLIPVEMLDRLAGLYTRGAIKYGDSNWKLAEDKDAIERFKQSAWRHFLDWQAGRNSEEDHGIATVFNIFAYEWLVNNKK
jgi:hypothetical protein